MILFNRKFINIHGQIPDDLYERLKNGKKRVKEEDKAIRERIVKKLCAIESEEHFKNIMKSLEPLLRNKTSNSYYGR